MPMPTQQELEQTYSQLDTLELLKVVERSEDYTELALNVVNKELQRRNVPVEDIDHYINQQKQYNELVFRGSIAEELSNWHKMLFYIIFVPLLCLPFRLNYRQDGHQLKLYQSRYYNFCGFIGLISAGVFTSLLNLGDTGAAILWITFFIPACLLDDKFNRQHLLKKFHG